MINILNTRPKEGIVSPDCDMGAGYNIIHAPLMEISRIDCKIENLSQYKAIIFTSYRAVKYFESADILGTKIFAIGKRTLKELKKKAFINIECSHGNGKDLYDLISSHNYQDCKLLHIRGMDIAFEMSDLFLKQNITLDSLITYETKEILELSDDIIDKIKNHEIDFISFLSSKTAQIFVKIVKKYKIEQHLSYIKCLCFSDMVLNSIKGLSWDSIHISDKYEEESIYKLARDLS